MLILDKRYSVTLSPKGVLLLEAVRAQQIVPLHDCVPGRIEIPLSLETMLGESYARSVRPGLRQGEAKKG